MSAFLCKVLDTMNLFNVVTTQRLKARIISVSSMVLLFALILVPIIANENPAFAQTVVSAVRTMELKANFDKIVEAGGDQNIRITVRDQASGQPISTANVRFTVYYPGGAPLRVFNLLTGRDGVASLTLPTSENAPLGQYGLDVYVTATGYADTSFGTVNFGVFAHAKEVISLHDYKHASRTISGKNHHSHD
jgi:hypothetical protein